MSNSNKALASMILGGIALIMVFAQQFAFIGIILAIVGLIMAIDVKKSEPENGQAKIGFVLCAVAIGLCAITFISCMACVGCIGCVAAVGSV